MKRALLLIALLAIATGLYLHFRANAGPARFHDALVAEIARRSVEDNPLCASLAGVDGFPYTATLQRRADGERSNAPPPPPRDLLSGQRWRDLVAAGLVTETEHRSANHLLTGYTYALTDRGRALYAERPLPKGGKEVRFCLGQPMLKRITAIESTRPRGEELEVPVRYVLKVEAAGPELSDGKATALGIRVPPHSTGGELDLPEMHAVFVLDRKSGQVRRVKYLSS